MADNSYDYDLVVVGAGPAGMSAAIRARWLRTYHSVPASVAIIDSRGTGGIANWKEIRMTGPSWVYKGTDLAAIMEKDIGALNIPVIKEEVVSTELSGEYKIVRTPSRELKARSVIVATGLRYQANERDYIGKGLIPTLKDHMFMENLLKGFLEKNVGKKVIIYGSKGVLRFWRYFQKLNNGRLEAQLVAEPPYTGDGTDCVVGRLHGIEGEEHVSRVVIRQGDKLEKLSTDYIILDFESYMLFTNTALPFGEIEKKDGFLKVGHNLHTNIPGVFGAGDVTGPPFGVITALGRGVHAGFEAYIYSFEKKFGERPPTYAFYASQSPEIVPRETGFSVPELLDNDRIVLLQKPECLDVGEELLQLFDGKYTVAEAVKEMCVSSGVKAEEAKERLQQVFSELLLDKHVTLHR